MTKQLELVLYQPEIPPNTGNIARLCAAVDLPLHLVGPLGFSLSDKYLKRAGLDYWPHVQLTCWNSWQEFSEFFKNRRFIFTSARRGTYYHHFNFLPDDMIILGPETRGLPHEILDQSGNVVKIPISGKVRSINLSTSAGILLFEALRQTGGLPD